MAVEHSLLVYRMAVVHSLLVYRMAVSNGIQDGGGAFSTPEM